MIIKQNSKWRKPIIVVFLLLGIVLLLIVLHGRGEQMSKPMGNLKCKLGSPDLVIFFTSTMSHKMVVSALSEVKSTETVIARSHSGSMSALKNILDNNISAENMCPVN